MEKESCTPHNGEDMVHLVNQALWAIKRPWHLSIRQDNAIHPSVWRAFRVSRPDNWQDVVLQYPHLDREGLKLCYYRNERDAERGSLTTTTAGRYIRSHWGHLPDHIIRDIVALDDSGGCEIITDMDEMVKAVMHGPLSCMKSYEGTTHEFEFHPYRVYDPKYGWALAVKRDGGSIKARALVNRDSDGKRYFVRTFASSAYGKIAASTTLNAWLKSQGYEHRGAWELGTKLALIEDDDSRLKCAYIDGDNSYVSVKSDHLVIVDYENSDHDATEPTGFLDGNGFGDDDRVECYDCGDMVDPEDTYPVGYDGDYSVCEYCMDNRYTSVLGRRGFTYLISNNNAVLSTDGNYYDEDHLSANGQVELEQEYEGCTVAPEDDTVYVEGDGYYHVDDSGVVFCEGDDTNRLKDDCVQLSNGNWALEDDCVKTHDNVWELREDCSKLHDGQWALDDDCWECAELGLYFPHTEVEPVNVDGDTYHPNSDVAKRFALFGSPKEAQQTLELEPS